MLLLFLIVVDILVTVGGIYLFDFRADQVINRPLIILLSIFVGVIAAILAAILVLEITYWLFAYGRPHNNRFKHKVGKQITKVPLDFMRVKTTVIGREHLPKDSRFLIYANHTSELDISILMHVLKDHPVAFLAKQAIMKYANLGKWAKSIGCVMLDRENNRRGAESIAQVVKHVQAGSTMIIFPEGTLTRDVRSLLKFRNGAFKVALASGVPVVPISLIKDLNYNNRRWPKARKFTIIIHEPIPYETFQDWRTLDLAQHIRDIIRTDLGVE